MRQALAALVGIIIVIVPASFAGDCGDVNNDGPVNILDITYLIDNLYMGGPEPNCGLETGIVTDIDGNMYVTIKIGDQWWMAENLRVTHYCNGDSIPQVSDPFDWDDLSSGAYCEFMNDPGNVAAYGRLYNWYAVDDSRNLAPEGWHVPTDADWKQLEMYLGMSQAQADSTGWRGTDEGGKLKQDGITHWESPNTGATNESGFTALPGGYREDFMGYYMGMSYVAAFWSSTEIDANFVWARRLSSNHSGVLRPDYMEVDFGLSIRCVRD